MQLKIPFRVARGAWVVIFILVAHAAIAWWFLRMRVRVPDMGPVFLMFLDDTRDAPRDSAPPKSDPPPAPKADPAQPGEGRRTK
jgi:hypothetical protein